MAECSGIGILVLKRRTVLAALPAIRPSASPTMEQPYSWPRLRHSSRISGTGCRLQRRTPGEQEAFRLAIGGPPIRLVGGHRCVAVTVVGISAWELRWWLHAPGGHGRQQAHHGEDGPSMVAMGRLDG